MNSSTDHLDILGDVKHRLHAVRRYRQRTELETGIYRFVWIASCLVMAAGILELIGRFGIPFRTTMISVTGTALALAAAWYVFRPLLLRMGVLPSADDYTIAREVGTNFEEIRDRLLNLLQLDRDLAAGTALYSRELALASFEDLRGALADVNFLGTVDRLSVRRERRGAMLACLGCVLLLAGFPSALPQAWFRLLHCRTEFVPPALYAFEVQPGSREVVKGETVEIAVRVLGAPGAPAAAVRRDEPLLLFTCEAGASSYDRKELWPDSSGAYRTSVASIRQSTDYFVMYANVRSEEYHLLVVDRPVLRSMRVRLEYPGYTKTPPRLQDDFVGDVAGIPGTRVSISGSTNKTLRQARIHFGDGTESALAAEGTQFSGSFTLRHPGTYRIIVRDQQSMENTNPIVYDMKVLADLTPAVTIVHPGKNVDIAGADQLPMLMHIEDDFGFSKLRIAYRLVHSRYEEIKDTYKSIGLDLAGVSGVQADVPFIWNLDDLHLAPEEVIEYFAEVTDNDAVGGPKTARSQTYLLRLPSLEEVYAETRQTQEQSRGDMKQALEEAKKLKEEIDAVDRDLKKNKPMDWQQQKKTEELAKKYQELQKKVEEAKQKVDQMVDQMQQHNLLSAETMQKYMELQKLMQDINSEFLQKALQQMQQAMQSQDRRQVQEAMKSLQFSEERFRQGLDRTINLMKRLQIGQKMDEVKHRAEALAEEQRQVKEEAAKNEGDPKKRDELAARQEQLGREQERLEQEARALQDKMEEFFTEMPMKRMEAINQKMGKQQNAKKMRQSAQSMRQGNMQQAQQMQQESQESLEDIASDLDKMQQEMNRSQDTYAMKQMRRAINNLIEVSKEQETLIPKAQNAAPNSPSIRDIAQRQASLMQDLGNILNSLGELSQRSFAVTPEMGRSLGEALGRMQSSMQSLENRNGPAAAQNQQQAMASLNKAAMQVQSALSQMMQQGGSGGGLMGQLQMFAQQQMSLNQRTQQLQQGQGMSMEQAAQAARLAQEQDALRKSLEQLNREAQISGERKKLLGDLDRIARDMQEVANALQQGNVSPDVQRKQERILSRMLESARSMRERDFEQKRLARTGKEMARPQPKTVDPSTIDQNRLGDDLLNAGEQGYSKDFQELIRKYLEALQKVRTRQ